MIIQKSNIAYRGKVTNALEVTPEKDEFKKEGLGKGSKILLGTLGLAGIAVTVDRLFLKGKYTDDILKFTYDGSSIKSCGCGTYRSDGYDPNIATNAFSR